MLPDVPIDEELPEEVTQDDQMPFQPADDQAQGAALDDTHPATDSILDSQELYDEGMSGAAEVDDPEAH